MIDILFVILLTIPIGLLGALTGLGGGSIVIPILVALGIDVRYAIAASMVCVIATSSGSAATSVREGITNIRAGMYLAVYTVIGALIGATVSGFVDPRVLYFSFAAFLLVSLLGMRGTIREEVPSSTRQDRLAKWLELKGEYYDKSLKRGVPYELTSPLRAGGAMLITGLAAGMLGIGAGAFAVAIQESVLHMPAKVSSTTSNFIIGVTALAGASVYFVTGSLYLGLAAPMVVGTSVGAVVGGRIINHFRSRTIKIIFLVVVTYLVLQMFYKGMTS